ncbi:MAG TPA: GNAT family N-acetyltransferase [Caulobacteraceae bacterium]|nr:GNAT family N-acetyltransferase [Caulobacteraceae bacterium]
MPAARPIRDATPDDAPALAARFVEAWRDEHAGHLPETTLAARSRAESEANWRKTLGREEGRDAAVLVAGAGPLDGLVVGVREAADWPGIAEVTLVQVARSARRRGLGSALMRAMARRLGQEGASALIVRVLEVNEEARRFYEALGAELSDSVHEVDESGVSFTGRTYLWPDIGRLST